jgi:hypothetical protein
MYITVGGWIMKRDRQKDKHRHTHTQDVFLMVPLDIEDFMGCPSRHRLSEL